ncbi:methylmalonyl Co-A mutase-associated GTPase MeaB [Fulvivirga sediminis]|uniref:Methylmalonyl Co-A mutase-associated GTPase MeaB n=1 Tax=Fulvivirga sediminis TaxID=2803949 RepID=A0A937JZA1_9BACT|nr:methylmalonyl Co-A mutase-associated GTPase MeaB [Fulvivirga sediminis]MBL3655075.1 methylmalonyl Co-A mutase-associated GTPase MeaB [Fulvivirga sediminis]
MKPRRKRLAISEYVEGVLSGNKVILSRAITLIESRLDSDFDLAEQVLEQILPHTGQSKRIGITGVPGVGKSTFIESLGLLLAEKDHQLAILTIDPSSQRSGGSILGDKTRMEKLSHHPNAFIRPSATGNSLGGVANKTRETMLLCEAAGYDHILIETVGVGQSEVAVKGMVDFFLLLMLAGAGDELQGIKKGIMEMADAIAITKADQDNIAACNRAKGEYKNALHLFPPSETGWQPEVLTCSALTHDGMESITDLIQKYYSHMDTHLHELRKQQNISWLHENISFLLQQNFYSTPAVKHQIKIIESQVGKGSITPQAAARQLLELAH